MWLTGAAPPIRVPWSLARANSAPPDGRNASPAPAAASPRRPVWRQRLAALVTVPALAVIAVIVLYGSGARATVGRVPLGVVAVAGGVAQPSVMLPQTTLSPSGGPASGDGVVPPGSVFLRKHGRWEASEAIRSLRHADNAAARAATEATDRVLQLPQSAVAHRGTALAHPYAPPDSTVHAGLRALLNATAPTVLDFLDNPLSGCGAWAHALEAYAVFHAAGRAHLSAAAAAAAGHATAAPSRATPAPPPPRVIVWACRETPADVFSPDEDDGACGGLGDRMGGIASVLAFALVHRWVLLLRSPLLQAAWHSPLLNLTFDAALLPPPAAWVTIDFARCPGAPRDDGGPGAGPPCPSGLVPDAVDAEAGIERWARHAPVVIAVGATRSPLITMAPWTRARLARVGGGVGDRAARLTPCLLRAAMLPNAAVVSRALPALAAAHAARAGPGEAEAAEAESNAASPFDVATGSGVGGGGGGSGGGWSATGPPVAPPILVGVHVRLGDRAMARNHAHTSSREGTMGGGGDRSGGGDVAVGRGVRSSDGDGGSGGDAGADAVLGRTWSCVDTAAAWAAAGAAAEIAAAERRLRGRTGGAVVATQQVAAAAAARVRFLVAADVPAVRNAAALRYGAAAVVSTGIVASHVDKIRFSNDVPEVGTDIAGAPVAPTPLQRHIDAAADFLLLSRADVFVVPGASSFGRYAWGYSLAPDAFLSDDACARVHLSAALRHGSGF